MMIKTFSYLLNKSGRHTWIPAFAGMTFLPHPRHSREGGNP